MPRIPRLRTVRRAQARHSRRGHPPRHVRRVVAQAGPLPAPPVTRTPREDQALYASVYDLLRAHLLVQHADGTASPWPVAKRLAVLVSGLVAGDTAGLGTIERTVGGLAITGAKPESIARRLRRILDDARLDPTHLLPDLLVTLLPVLLRDVLAKHATSARRGAKAHRAWGPRLRVVVDDSSQAEHVHLLVVGLAYRGLVVPLLVRTWQQNAPLPEGEYWTQLQRLLSDVQGLLPAALRDHVLLVADRAFGVPRLLDVLGGLGWHWLLRVQGQTRVLLRDGTVRAVHSLVPLPGATWLGRFDPQRPTSVHPPTSEPVAVFKAAGWRASQVVAVWALGAEEPWLLVTSLAPTPERLQEYAERWGIERLFLSWKSHGWDLEACGVHDPIRLGRLVSGVVLATYWRLAAGVLAATQQLADLHARAQRRRALPLVVRQRPLPLDANLQPHQGASRPYAAKQSDVTRGTAICRTTPCRWQTPPVLWSFPDWHAPIWSRQAQQVYDGRTS